MKSLFDIYGTVRDRTPVLRSTVLKKEKASFAFSESVKPAVKPLNQINFLISPVLLLKFSTALYR